MPSRYVAEPPGRGAHGALARPGARGHGGGSRAPVGGRATILQRFGIDACCGGHLTLAQAAASAGIPVKTLLCALEPLVTPPTT